MSLPLFNIPTKPYLGVKPNAINVKECVPLTNAPGVLTVTIDWSLYVNLTKVLADLTAGTYDQIPSAAVEIDLSALSPANKLEGIRSVYIDNTASPTPIYLYFPDTQFGIVCKPYSVLLSPVWTWGLKAVAYANDFTIGNLPVSVIQFSNLHLSAPFLQEAPLVDNVPTASRTAYQVNLAPALVNTYANQSIGQNLATRRVFAVLRWRGTVASGIGDAAGNIFLGGNIGTQISRDTQINGAGTEKISTSIWAGVSAGYASSTTTELRVEFGIAPASFNVDIVVGYNFKNNASIVGLYTNDLQAHAGQPTSIISGLTYAVCPVRENSLSIFSAIFITGFVSNQAVGFTSSQSGIEGLGATQFSYTLGITYNTYNGLHYGSNLGSINSLTNMANAAFANARTGACIY